MTYFGLAGANGCAACPDPHCICNGTPSPTPVFDAAGRPVYFATGVMLLVIEGKPGRSGSGVGRDVPDPIPGQPDRPDLQLLANRNLGDGSAAICDTNSVELGGGGVPGFDVLEFGSSQAVTDALVDFACRFGVFATSTGSPCTLNEFGVENVLTTGGLPSGSRQFCYLANVQNARLPSGDTVFKVQLRDNAGNFGPSREMVVRSP